MDSKNNSVVYRTSSISRDSDEDKIYEINTSQLLYDENSQKRGFTFGFKLCAIASGVLLIIITFYSYQNFDSIATKLYRTDPLKFDGHYTGIYGSTFNYTTVFVDDKRTIPYSIYQMSKDVEAVSQEAFKDLNPHYYTRMYNNPQFIDIMRSNMPQHFTDVFDLFPKPVLQADLIRYVVLFLYGGVYSDTDTKAVEPLDNWIPKDKRADLLIGIENDEFEGDTWMSKAFARKFQFLQWSLLARPFHPVYGILIDRIIQVTPRMARMYKIRKEHRRYFMVMDWTGPGAFSDAVYSYLVDQDVKDPNRHYQFFGYPTDEEFDLHMTKLENRFEELKNKGDSVTQEEFNQFEAWADYIYENMIKIKVDMDNEYLYNFRQNMKFGDYYTKDMMFVQRDYFTGKKIQHYFAGTWKSYASDENNLALNTKN